MHGPLAMWVELYTSEDRGLGGGYSMPSAGHGLRQVDAISGDGSEKVGFSVIGIRRPGEVCFFSDVKSVAAEPGDPMVVSPEIGNTQCTPFCKVMVVTMADLFLSRKNILILDGNEVQFLPEETRCDLYDVEYLQTNVASVRSFEKGTDQPTLGRFAGVARRQKTMIEFPWYNRYG